MEYVLWSVRSAGWYASGHYTSDLDSATRLPRSEAIDLTRKHRRDGEHLMLPILVDDLT